jgi:carbonyl reductase 1
MSKVAVIAATRVQQRMFDEHVQRDLVVNACCPGYIKTDMSSNKGTGTLEQGADTPAYLAVLPHNVRSPRGEFVAERKIIQWTC